MNENFERQTARKRKQEGKIMSVEKDPLVLGCIPAESIIGLDGAVDTAWAKEEVVLCKKSSKDEQTEQIQCDEEGATTDCDATVVIRGVPHQREQVKEKTTKKTKYNDGDQFKEEILSMKRRKIILEEAKLELEERKVAVLEGILHIMSSSDQ